MLEWDNAWAVASERCFEFGPTGSGFLVVSGEYISWLRPGDMSAKPWPEGSA